MCGIVATIGYNTSDVNVMLDAIEHRGKDYRGINEFEVHDKKIVLGHNRLSINDISSAGNQPMEYDGLWLVVNGEIWTTLNFEKSMKNEDMNLNPTQIQRLFCSYIKKVNYND